MKKYSLKDRAKYWLDKQMSKGTISIIKLLTFAVLFVVILVTVLIILFRLRDSVFSAFWDSLATIINAWMPSSDDGEIGYVILNTVTAVVGLLFTSILIGVVSSDIKEKLDNLRKGNSVVLESGHTVILGYNLGEHGLLRQLILASEKEKRCIVILTDIEKPEIEEDLKKNVDIPKNIRIICRNGIITNVNDLRCCSIENSSVIIINALNDNRRIKTILAVSALKKEFDHFDARIVSCVTDEKHLLPRNKMLNKKMTIMKTDDFMAKVIAHASTEPGISIAFKELLNFEENELYFEKEERLVGMNVMQATSSLDKATFAGIKRGSKVTLNPYKNVNIEKEDELILFEKNRGSYRIIPSDLKNIIDKSFSIEESKDKGRLTIFGFSKILATIVNELDTSIKSIKYISNEKEDIGRIMNDHPDFQYRFVDMPSDQALEEIAKESDHVVVLSDRNIDKDDSDTDNIILLLKLMDIKEKKHLDFNTVVELQTESSYNVAPKDSSIDYIVGSSIASLVLAQMAGNPGLEEIFDELLSKNGNELYSKSVGSFNLELNHDYSYNTLKQIALSYRYTLFGYILSSNTVLNPDSGTVIRFKDGDRLIVLGRD